MVVRRTVLLWRELFVKVVFWMWLLCCLFLLLLKHNFAIGHLTGFNIDKTFIFYYSLFADDMEIFLDVSLSSFMSSELCCPSLKLVVVLD